MKVRQLDHVVLKLDACITGEVGEGLDANHINNEIESRQILQGEPDLVEEVRTSVSRNVGRIQLFEEYYRDREKEDHNKNQSVVLIDGESPGPTILEICFAIRIVGGWSVEQESLDEA